MRRGGPGPARPEDDARQGARRHHVGAQRGAEHHRQRCRLAPGHRGRPGVRGPRTRRAAPGRRGRAPAETPSVPHGPRPSSRQPRQQGALGPGQGVVNGLGPHPVPAAHLAGRQALHPGGVDEPGLGGAERPAPVRPRSGPPPATPPMCATPPCPWTPSRRGPPPWARCAPGSGAGPGAPCATVCVASPNSNRAHVGPVLSGVAAYGRETLGHQVGRGVGGSLPPLTHPMPVGRERHPLGPQARHQGLQQRPGRGRATWPGAAGPTGPRPRYPPARTRPRSPGPRPWPRRPPIRRGRAPGRTTAGPAGPEGGRSGQGAPLVVQAGKNGGGAPGPPTRPEPGEADGLVEVHGPDVVRRLPQLLPHRLPRRRGPCGEVERGGLGAPARRPKPS